MDYGLLRTYGLWNENPAHQVGGCTMLWDIRGYGLSGVWFTRDSTVVTREIKDID